MLGVANEDGGNAGALIADYQNQDHEQYHNIRIVIDTFPPSRYHRYTDAISILTLHRLWRQKTRLPGAMQVTVLSNDAGWPRAFYPTCHFRFREC